MNTYVRTGEQTLNSCYKPCHLVQYCKYLRFFTDGKYSFLSYSADQKFKKQTVTTNDVLKKNL